MVMNGGESQRPLIQIGWVVLDGDGPETRALVAEASRILREDLEGQFPEYEWQTAVALRRLARRRRQIDPLELLELGVQEKVEHRWDFALVLTSAELVARKRPFIFGVPSSALETAVLSSGRCEGGEAGTRHTVQLARFLFASLLGLRPRDEGAMRPPEVGRAAELPPFDENERRVMRERLDEVGDERLEETRDDWNRRLFKLSTLKADPRGILSDVIGYRPWQQPFRLGRLTAAAFLSALLSFLGAEVWELGVGIEIEVLAGGVVLSVLAATWILMRGQNLSEVTRHVGLSEQVARSELILWICLFIGMSTLWLLLGAASFIMATLLPREVVENWIGVPLNVEARLRFSAFVSTLGTLAGGLGGNLEEEDAFKAQFFFDEEV